MSLASRLVSRSVPPECKSPVRAAVFRCFSSAPGWTRTTDPGIRKFRRDDYASPDETTKSIVSRCRPTTSVSRPGFAQVASITALRAETAADLRNPQIRVGLPPVGTGTGVAGEPATLAFYQRSRHGVEGLRERVHAASARDQRRQTVSVRTASRWSWACFTRTDDAGRRDSERQKLDPVSHFRPRHDRGNECDVPHGTADRDT